MTFQNDGSEVSLCQMFVALTPLLVCPPRLLHLHPGREGLWMLPQLEVRTMCHVSATCFTFDPFGFAFTLQSTFLMTAALLTFSR